MEIPFNLTYVFGPDSNPVDNAYALRILLNCLIELNLAYLRFHPAPKLYESGVVYGRTKEWEPIPTLYRRGYGDCKSLTAAKIAENIRDGIDCLPVFRFAKEVPDDSQSATLYHILIQQGSSMKDPSKVLGMGKDENAKFFGPGSWSRKGGQGLWTR